MADDMRSNLHRALDDLTSGMEALLGLGRSSPDLVTELLGRGGDGQRAPQLSTDRGRRRAAPQRPRRVRRSSRTHLTRVK